VSIETQSACWQFRPSQTKELGRLYDVWHASVIATHHFLSQSDLNEICVQVKDDYLPHNSLLVSVDDDDRAIGFMGMTGHEIDSLFIEPTYRGLGLGRAFVERAAAESSCLEVGVNSQNEQAIGFYQAVGFSVYAESPTDDDGRPYPILRMQRLVARNNLSYERS
jgi:putative acetyltransferase